jgi:hypothetical protein
LYKPCSKYSSKQVTNGTYPEKKRLIKSKHFNAEIKEIGDDLDSKPLAVVGTALVGIAEVIKRKYQQVYKGVIEIHKNISKGPTEPKQPQTMRNVKKPIGDTLGDGEVSLDKELTESVDRPLFQNEKDKSSSGQGMKLDSSGQRQQIGSSGRKNNLQGENMKFDLDGFFVEPGDNFTTEQHEFLQHNLFTQDINMSAERTNTMEKLSFDEIKQKLDRDFDLKTSKPKQGGKVYLTMDSSATKEREADDDSQSTTFDFDPEFDPTRKMATEFALYGDYALKDFDEILMSLPKDSREAHRASEAKIDGQVDIDYQMPEAAMDYQFNSDAFQEMTNLFTQPLDQFIGDDKANLELPPDATTSQGGYADRILDLFPRGGKKKQTKMYFSDVVNNLSAERDAADLFYDLMCAARTGDIKLSQAFPSAIDKDTRLPVIEISLSTS